MPAPGGFDAVQFALARRSARTGSSPDDEATRYEFLLVPSAPPASPARCLLLLEPETPLATAAERRSLAGLELEGAQVAVKRVDGWTHYECSIPFRTVRAFRPAPGREFCFSLLIHDPDGTGVRDWGEAAGLWPAQRNRFAWCAWEGVKWGDQLPFDGKIEWGLCSSKH